MPAAGATQALRIAANVSDKHTGMTTP